MFDSKTQHADHGQITYRGTEAESIHSETKKDREVITEEVTRLDTRYEVENGEDDLEFLASFDDAKRAAVYRRVDVRLLPVLAILYLAAFLDRSNIGNAKIEGLLEDLHMSGSQYNIALSIFFVPYILFEVPANSILNRYFRMRPSWWIGGLCVLWGIVMTLHGIVETFAQLCVVRTLLGVFEAGFFPGAVFIVSSWYPRQMLQLRITLFYVSAALAGAFSGLLAFCIAKLDGVGGLSGWQYIFLLEGAATVLLGLAVPFVLVDTAKTAKWLNEDERRFLLLNNGLQDNSATAKEHESTVVNWRVIRSVFTDWQVYVLVAIYYSSSVPTYATNFTMPTIIKSMGYTSAHAQLMSIPPYVVGALSALVCAVFSDRFKRRAYPIIVAQIVVCIGLSILMALATKIKDNIGPCYLGLCFVAFNYPVAPGVNTWASNNFSGHARRAVGVALVICLANTGGIVGSYIFLEREAPRYATGYGTAFACTAMGLVAAIVLELTLIRINANRAKMTPEEISAKYTEQELADLGDKSPLYRYML